MAILIKGMEMPRSCFNCRCPRACQAINRRIDEMYRTELFPQDHRHSDCPLTEVPEPHGRLINADALVDKHFGKDYLAKAMTASKEEMRTALVNIPLVINNAPTVIPASEEGET